MGAQMGHHTARWLGGNETIAFRSGQHSVIASKCLQLYVFFQPGTYVCKQRTINEVMSHRINEDKSIKKRDGEFSFLLSAFSLSLSLSLSSLLSPHILFEYFISMHVNYTIIHLCMCILRWLCMGGRKHLLAHAQLQFRCAKMPMNRAMNFVLILQHAIYIPASLLDLVFWGAY